MTKAEYNMYLTKFSGITISRACIETKVDKANLYHGSISKEKIARVVDNIDEKIQELHEFKIKCESEEE